MKNLVWCALTLTMVLTFAGCGDETHAPDATGIADPQLVGSWYEMKEQLPSALHPPRIIRGFSLSRDLTFRRLAVEIATGKLDYLLDSSRVTVFFARGGRISISTGFGSDTISYSLKGDTLFVTGSSLISGTWIRSIIGNTVTEPVQSSLTATVEGTEHSIRSVASFPGGFVAMNPSFTLHGYFFDAFAWDGLIMITIEDFTGPGVYAIKPGQGVYNSIEGDIAWGFHTDTLNTGTITVDTFDGSGGRCTGSFEFTSRNRKGYGYPTNTRRISNGRFSVPVYR